jgi:TRAP-type C4-dicarboxylate transport system permease small subunit
MLISVTWPGMLPFARVEPFILGLPFSMAWLAIWIAGSVVVLYLLDRVERRYRADDPADTHGEGQE